MTPESFTYWLQGFVELSESNAVPNEKQWLMIKDHLKLVFDKKTPDRSGIQYRDNMPTWPPKEGLPSITDLIGKKVDPSYWQLNPLQITC